MSGQELKDALFAKVPVKCDGIEYLRIYEIVYRVPDNKLMISAGLLDKNGRSVTYALADKVELLEAPVQ